MVQTKAERPHRRNRGPDPRGTETTKGEAIPAIPRDPSPNMTARREMDRQEHVKRARHGATRKQASMHADEEAGGH